MPDRLVRQRFEPARKGRDIDIGDFDRRIERTPQEPVIRGLGNADRVFGFDEVLFGVRVRHLSGENDVLGDNAVVEKALGVFLVLGDRLFRLGRHFIQMADTQNQKVGLSDFVFQILFADLPSGAECARRGFGRLDHIQDAPPHIDRNRHRRRRGRKILIVNRRLQRDVGKGRYQLRHRHIGRHRQLFGNGMDAGDVCQFRQSRRARRADGRLGAEPLVILGGKGTRSRQRRVPGLFEGFAACRIGRGTGLSGIRFGGGRLAHGRSCGFGRGRGGVFTGGRGNRFGGRCGIGRNRFGIRFGIRFGRNGLGDKKAVVFGQIGGGRRKERRGFGHYRRGGGRQRRHPFGPARPAVFPRQRHRFRHNNLGTRFRLGGIPPEAEEGANLDSVGTDAGRGQKKGEEKRAGKPDRLFRFLPFRQIGLSHRNVSLL